MQEQEIFQHYELKNWEFSPRLYKILAGSAVLNICIVFALAQANFLTAKSCDTPLMDGVCSVLDALYVGSAILDTDTGYVNEDYVKTELEDADITFINLTGETPPLEYPAGYFAVSNPEQIQPTTEIVGLNNDFSTTTTNPTTTDNTFIPGITNNTKNPTITNGKTNNYPTIKPQVTPKPNKNVLDGVLPGGNSDNPTVVKNQKTQKTQNKTTTDGTTAQTNNSENTQQSNPVEEKINRKPLEDLGDSLNEKLAKNELDLNKNFLVVMNGTLTKEGKLDKSTSKYVRSEGDEQMLIAAKDSIEAIGDSGFLIYLKNQNIDKANLTLAQNDEQIYIQLISDMKDVNKANTAASGLNTTIQALILADNNGFAKLDESSKLLIKNAKITSDGKNFVLTVLIPKAEGQAMISKSLKDRAEKKNKQPNSNSEVSSKTNSETAVK